MSCLFYAIYYQACTSDCLRNKEWKAGFYFPPLVLIYVSLSGLSHIWKKLFYLPQSLWAPLPPHSPSVCVHTPCGLCAEALLKKEEGRPDEKQRDWRGVALADCWNWGECGLKEDKLLVCSFGLSCRYKRFLSCLGCSSRSRTKYFSLTVHYFNSFVPIAQQPGQATVLGRLSLSVSLSYTLETSSLWLCIVKCAMCNVQCACNRLLLISLKKTILLFYTST